MGGPPDPKATASAKARPKRPGKAPKRDRQDWLDVARKVLVSRGIERVKIEPLAALLGVTTGSFYHHFRNRPELLEGLLQAWEHANTAPMFRAVEAAGDDPSRQLDAVFEVWITEKEYSPAYDAAVRAWAHSSKSAADAVRRVDDSRIALLAGIFERLGYDPQRAFIRARITYFHQVGYQAMEISEPLSQRRGLLHFYREALVGDPTKSS